MKLRVCLLNRTSTATKHQMSHREIDELFRDIPALRVILAQASKAIEPTESAFSNPAQQLNFKAARLAAMGDFRPHAGKLLAPTQQSRAVVAAVKDCAVSKTDGQIKGVN